MTIKIAITGVSGRMGKALAEAVQQHTNTVLGAATVRAGNSLTGADVGELIGMGKVGVVIASDLNDVIDDVDAVIDFTSPAATLAHTEICATKKKPIIIGTTGFTEEEKNTLEALSQRLPVVLASNFSTGVNVSFKLLDVAARIFGDDADIEVYEAHHRHKVDAPSGTALSMGEVLADALGRKLTDVAVYGREGQVGARPKNEIGFATARGGDVVGEHTVSFFADGERLEITHKASSRMAFAHGAVRAAIWACDQQVGIFDMQDVLGLK